VRNWKRGEYRNPKRALFLSLVVPGLGQAYVGQSTFNYVRAGAYFATEVTLGVLWYQYTVVKYDREVARYRRLADEHWDQRAYEAMVSQNAADTDGNRVRCDVPPPAREEVLVLLLADIDTPAAAADQDTHIRQLIEWGMKSDLNDLREAYFNSRVMTPDQYKGFIRMLETFSTHLSMAANQLLSHALEQLLARSKRMRDTEAATLNMQLVTWRDGRGANEAFVAGTGDALRTWRQP
jgi:hypothetical protein